MVHNLVGTLSDTQQIKNNTVIVLFSNLDKSENRFIIKRYPVDNLEQDLINDNIEQ